jgi:hypothetical protein
MANMTLGEWMITIVLTAVAIQLFANIADAITDYKNDKKGKIN